MTTKEMLDHFEFLIDPVEEKGCLLCAAIRAALQEREGQEKIIKAQAKSIAEMLKYEQGLQDELFSLKAKWAEVQRRAREIYSAYGALLLPNQVASLIRDIAGEGR